MAKRTSKACPRLHACGGFPVRSQQEIAGELSSLAATVTALCDRDEEAAEDYAMWNGKFRGLVGIYAEALASELANGLCVYCAHTGGLERLRERRNSEASHG